MQLSCRKIGGGGGGLVGLYTGVRRGEVYLPTLWDQLTELIGLLKSLAITVLGRVRYD